MDEKAKLMAFSRRAYVRRALERERASTTGEVTAEHLARAAALASDLENHDVMSDAWS